MNRTGCVLLLTYICFSDNHASSAENNVNDFSIAQLVFFMSSSLGCASCLSSVPVFAGQLSLLKREHSAGMSVFAYAIGRMTADLLFVVFNAMIFTGKSFMNCGCEWACSWLLCFGPVVP